MTKDEIITRLQAGEKIEEILPLIDGQLCMIYKSPEGFHPGEDVIYVPDVDLNDIQFNTGIQWTEEQEIHRLKAGMYTGNEFLQICGNNTKLAEHIFRYVDWQHPVSVLDGDYLFLQNEEWIEICGQTPAELWPDHKGEAS